MRIDNTTISAMLAVLRAKIVAVGPNTKVIRIVAADDTVLCDMPFDDLEEDTFNPGNFYFVDENDQKVLRSLVLTTGTPATFKIFDEHDNFVISGQISLINAGGDIVFNTLEWEADQVVIISSLKLTFSAE